MSNPLFEQPDGSTPLTEEERDGLMPSYITLRGELNEAEQANILEAEGWAFAHKRNVLNQAFLNGLHKPMFGAVWNWAGKFRRSGKNIGVDPHRIAEDLQLLIDDCAYWKEHGTYEPDEIASRFHHRLVRVHPYANGNGRHARMAADLFLKSMDCQRFSWGGESIVDSDDTRANYIAALRAADGHDYEPLLEFVRS
jgi:Fic-DOC domain mobile mystery protein B